jgi:hypothetical protein
VQPYAIAMLVMPIDPPELEFRIGVPAGTLSLAVDLS